jgi:hypothetical protein
MTSHEQMAYPEHVSNNVAIFVGLMVTAHLNVLMLET